MIAINKAEKEMILQRFPNIQITRTMKQKSKRHRYYCEESQQVRDFLDALRDGPQVVKESPGKRKV